jgi:hypothetical protein
MRRLMASQQYLASSAYEAMFVGCSRPLGARQLWKTSAPLRVKLFFWLVMHGRCWTAHRRWRHGYERAIHASSTTKRGDDGCVFSTEVRSSCLRSFRLQDLVSFLGSCSHSRKGHHAVVDGVEAVFTQTTSSRLRFLVLPCWMNFVEGKERENLQWDTKVSTTTARVY